MVTVVLVIFTSTEYQPQVLRLSADLLHGNPVPLRLRSSKAEQVTRCRCIEWMYAASQSSCMMSFQWSWLTDAKYSAVVARTAIWAPSWRSAEGSFELIGMNNIYIE